MLLLGSDALFRSIDLMVDGVVVDTASEILFDLAGIRILTRHLSRLG